MQKYTVITYAELRSVHPVIDGVYKPPGRQRAQSVQINVDNMRYNNDFDPHHPHALFYDAPRDRNDKKALDEVARCPNATVRLYWSGKHVTPGRAHDFGSYRVVSAHHGNTIGYTLTRQAM